MPSINTNVGAMLALQNLNDTQADLQVAQDRVSTGLKVKTAKDNGAIFAIAQNQRAASNSLNVIRESLNRGISTVDVAMAAGETISDLFMQMKEKATAAADTTLDASSRAAMNADFKALRDQVVRSVNNADFNGINMVKNAGTAVVALANADATNKITVAAQSMALTGANAVTGSIATTASIATVTLAVAMITKLNTAIAGVSTALGLLGTGSKALSAHMNFVNKLQDSIDAGVGNLVDADLAKESARLQSLQTKQQLGAQALSIANQSSSILLALFR